MREDDLVVAIAELTRRPSSRLILGIGDDAAVWQPSRSHRSVITTDALIEGVHFSLEWMSAEDAGWRAMAANASDVAAMGARPLLATIAFGVPLSADRDAILAWYRGLDACARNAGIEIAGGDLTRAPVWTIAITVVGEVRPTSLKRRSGARPGDVLAVTGELGASRAGLLHLSRRVRLTEPAAADAALAHRRPQPRVREGRWLAASRHVHAMIDCSDGLSSDLHRLLAASGAGARLETIPVAQTARVVAAELGEDPDAFALQGGEDFELLTAIDRRAYPHLSRTFAARFGRPLHRLGIVQADERVVLVKEGHDVPVTSSGWDHFSG